MKERFLPMLLLAAIGFAGPLKASAQTPEPSGLWKFDDPSALMEAAAGSMQMVPAIAGSASVSTATLEEAGIMVADGTTASDGAIFVPKTAALKVMRAEGAEATWNYSFMMDVKMPDAYVYNCFFQTSETNINDGELFISKGQIGIGALGGYYGRIWDNTWYRVVFTMSDGSAKVYVNGKKVIDCATTNARYEIDPWGLWLLCDEDGEISDTYVSEVAFWETPLTDEQVAAMEIPVPDPWIKSLSEMNDGDEFYIVSDRAKFSGSSTAKPKAMACQQENFPTTWGDIYVYWADLDKEADAFVWTAKKAGDQWAFLNKENGKYIGNMNTGENDVIFSDEPVGYTLTDLAEGEGNFSMINDDSEHSLHVQGYLRNDRGSNSLAKQEVGDDNYETAEAPRNGYPGRWHFVKIGSAAPVETGMKIETAADFEAFAQAVNDGETTLEAYLAADITLTGNVMVGTEANKYAGTFDGKGHTVTYSYDITSNYCGLFAFVNGATIRNLRVEGDVVTTAIHFGALIGRADGTVLVENVVTNVDITGNRSGVTGDGGMLGANYADITFNNCATLGAMGNPGSSMYSSFSAWSNGNSKTTLNNCYTACKLKDGTGTDNCFTLTHGSGSNTFNNCYYLNEIGVVQGNPITEDFASGEFCYKLNGDQSTINWYQTIGEDAMPVPFDSHEQVYANGELKCDGTSAGGTLVYSNSATSTVPPHTFDGGWCSVCGAWDANYLLPTDAEGFSLIANAKELAWFAEYMAQGNPSLNVKLTADIDLSTSDYPDLMIASESNRFSGIFDGDYHTITYNYTSVPDKWRGLFRSVEGATIRNLYVEGSATVTNIHFGALIGVAYGTVLVENVVTNVNITGKSGTGVQGDGGMLGANYADITFNNCATLGAMGYEGSSMYSPFSAWSNGDSKTTLNNCYSTCKLTDGTATGNCFTLTHQSGTVAINNSYYLNLVGKLVGGTQITEEQLANGALCYKLNSNQSTIAWTQTLDGSDPFPRPNPAGQRVYASGTARCDGAELEDNPFTYGNTESYPTVPDHQFNDENICIVCGTADPNAVEQNADGFYLIGTAKQLNWFAKKVEKGNTDIKALLTADIDLSTSDYPDLMIGKETAEFAGIFDGAGHTITYNYALVADKWRGLFAFVNGATIRNLYVEGSAVVTNIHFGALIGRAYGNVLVENVITNVDITGNHSGVTGDGGMLGANYANITFNNCATLGTMGYEGSSMYSSFSAWSNGSSSTTLNNCYSLCSLTDGTGTGNCFTLTHQSGTNTINNCYYLNEIGKVIAGDQTQVTAEQVANGELCAMLGQGWYQNIGTDAYPVFDKTHNVVKVISEAGYATMYIPDAVEIPAGVEACTGVIDGEVLKLSPVTGALPALTPVVLRGAAGIYGFPTLESAPDINAANDLLGTAEPLATTGSEYILAKPEDKVVGFYQAEGTIPAGKAYLVSTSGVKGFVFAEDDATGISSIDNGESIIDNAVYNLAGQRLQKMQRGINIINGKKILK